VSAGGEFFAELRPDNAAAAVGGINRNADVHFAVELSTSQPEKS
jgi:hypothetical protein